MTSMVVDTSGLSGVQKAAALLATLGQDASARIVKHLTEEEIQRVMKAVTQLSQLTSERAEAVVAEFAHMLLAHQYVIKGGFDYAKTMLYAAFSPEAAQHLLERVREYVDNDTANLDTLRKADPQQLASFILNEHPQTVALVLSHLGATQAAAMLSSLPETLRLDVATRMANLDQISPEIIGKIATVIDQKLKSLGEFSRESYGGVKAVAEMINRMDTVVSRDLLHGMEETDPKLHEAIRHLMFVFEDLIRLDVSDLKELIGRADKKLLTIALKGTSEQLRTRIFGVLSERAGSMLREDLEVLGAVRIREVEGAQQQIITMLRDMEKEGKISLQDNEYVV